MIERLRRRLHQVRTLQAQQPIIQALRTARRRLANEFN
jgi:hypothetical protein